MAERARVSELLNLLSSYATHDPLGNYVTYCWSKGGMRIVRTKYVCFPIRSPLLGRAGVGRKFFHVDRSTLFCRRKHTSKARYIPPPYRSLTKTKFCLHFGRQVYHDNWLLVYILPYCLANNPLL